MTCLGDFLVSRLSLQATYLMMCQLHAVYGEWLLKDDCWDFAVDNFKGQGGNGFEDDEADECFEDDDDLVEDENHDGEEDDGDEDAEISIVAEADENGEDYSVYGKVKDEDEEEDDDMCFEDFKETYAIEGGRSNGTDIYVNEFC
ncbi:hypothetical protein Bca52824_027091 [Brassica carinata]|uniref:Uncharacterized protein n=1 Tax=Brassica carinata TaxID=52824 RepID=A0A8X7SHS1_BRACI|nr:hypothetical protein Bca52824_027091 [Brassica carinata]